MPARKTQAIRLLDAKRIPYTATVYGDAETFHSADEAAAILGIPLSTMYKTLVVLRETRAKATPLIVMIASNTELDLKLLASSLNEKKLRMSTQKEAERLTGMQVGGISVLSLRNPAAFDILIDERARDLETIHISAGERGIEIALATTHLVALTSAKYVRATA
ncbi:MAG: YbaK/EbsC family protein [Chloroflexota bacterium]